MVRVVLKGNQIYIDGKPALIQAAALHYAYLPHPDLWSLVLLRLRVAGFNTVVLPIPWSYHSPAPGFYDFTGPRDLGYLLDAIEAAGLWLVVAPGPWVGADLDAGGLPSWLLQIPNAWPVLMDNGQIPVAFLRQVWEWWSHLIPFFQKRQNLLFWLADAGIDTHQDIYQQAFQQIAAHLEIPVILGNSQAGLETVISICGGTSLVVSGGGQNCHSADTQQITAVPLAAGEVLAEGALAYVVNPSHSGVIWGYWSGPGIGTQAGVGALIEEGVGIASDYYTMRCLLLATESLGQYLTVAQATNNLYPSDPNYLLAARKSEQTSVAFLGSVNRDPCDVSLSFPDKDGLLTTSPVPLPRNALRILPLNQPIAGGVLLFTSLELVLQIKVSGRYLLVFSNVAGGDILLSDDFRVLHSRGPIQTHKTEDGLAISFEKSRLASVLLSAFEEPLQILVLSPQLAARVWPLDDAWRTTPTYPAVWEPDSESPARGLVIGPELVLPQADGGFRYGVTDKGFGYRWGPWRGSDPNTWLSPFTWRSPQFPGMVALSDWESRPGAVEVLPDYDDAGWQRVPAGGPLAMEVFKLYQGFVWYRGHFLGHANSVTLTICHACDVFLNGEHIATLNETAGVENPTPKTLPLPTRLLQAENVLTVLVENLGRSQDPLKAPRPHGLLACKLDTGVPITWRIRGGLSGERSIQGFPGFADWELVPENGKSYVTWHRTTFALNLSETLEIPYFLEVDHVPAEALIFLNGQLVGHYWESRGLQHRFWLPQGVLRQQGENELLIAQWTRGGQPGLGHVQLATGTPYYWYQHPG
ncbi:MAG: beta-galactosidase [Anaerolineae bacterium]|nr:beta-galactosidase [Anaerolineae bacterium]